VIASIPSPHTGTIDIGPLVLHMYGLMLLVAIAGCVALTGVRWVNRGGDWDLIFRVAVWGVAAFEVWKGGLGVWGGIFLGCVVGAIVVKRSGESVTKMADAVAPGLLLAQGVGRIGNWFNQELYGKPTDLPWGLKIDIDHRVQGYEQFSTFQPTFLYELIYDLSMVGVLLLIDWRWRIRAPGLFALYVSFYTFGRFFEELLRIDPAHHIAGLRLNAWVSLILFVLSTAFFIWWQFFGGKFKSWRRGGSEEEGDRGPKMAIPRGRVRPGN